MNLNISIIKFSIFEMNKSFIGYFKFYFLYLGSLFFLDVEGNFYVFYLV